MTIITRPTSSNEIDLLLGHEFETLTIMDLDGNSVLKVKAPFQGFEHRHLETFDYDYHAAYGWNAYLGEVWIGSSEV